MSALGVISEKAGLSVVTASRAERGAEIRRRRLQHGIRSQREFAARTGVSRNALAGAEEGSDTTEEVTFLRLELWLDEYDRENQLSTRVGGAGAAAPDEVVSDLSMAPDVVEVEVEGPSTKWRVRFRGHADEADHLREQAEKLLRNVETLD